MAKKINYGKKNLIADEPYNPSDAKVRISILIDGDILLGFKKQAARTGIPYQTLMNAKLRELINQSGSDWKDQVREIVREELAKKAS
jgi:uncharacterized protein (DUF4415 family)